jgi:phosphoglycolate phosphatase
VNVLLDLDGTLTDPRAGIVGTIQYALGRIGRESPSENELLRFIGPPLPDCFAEMLAPCDAALVDQAVAIYRERYADIGLFENVPYPGIADALHALCERGARLFVATSKPTVIAQRIIGRFSLAQYFRGTWGSELDGGRADKSTLIAQILDEERLAKADTVMVGDRVYDAVGAKANGIVPVGVLWGYGSEEELRTAECKMLLQTPAELATLTV